MTLSPNHILGRIMARKREEVALARRERSASSLLEQCTEISPPRGFVRAIAESVQSCREQKGVAAIIAEVKRGSPSKGVIYPETEHPFLPEQIASQYAERGATCISCLTDRDFFLGEDHFLLPIRQRIALPILRKDFLYDPYQVIQSRALGADAILLIMAVLSTEQAKELEAAAQEMGLDVLVEVHDEAELEQAHELQTPLMGINNRDLKTFATSLECSLRLSKRVEVGRIVVSESGIHDAQDLLYLKQQDIHAFLIGEAFMRDRQPGEALARMLSATAAALSGKVDGHTD
ncbi:indole-3-glycerol phosphate synthase TrpC [Candidatus Magnetaquicoccus inordinatus]|uniref:indole-3-glycerol phosphate synthase TrpC n=1 Tax=Candidatus Magnetaquicoccus inordinatus TaxID=2496818 RepID=UPI00102B52BF|nr:indole-3-glycerol phosphate synthase TrpC [Candidatus Magnetaquicoccus inordinatus]